MTTITKTKIITETDVISFLQQNPDFFNKQPSLLKQLKLHHKSGSAISLLERQNQLLRSENKTLCSKLEQFVEVATANNQLFLQLEQLVAQLLLCKTLEAFCTFLKTRLKELYEFDDIEIVLLNQPSLSNQPWLNLPLTVMNDYFSDIYQTRSTAFCGGFSSEKINLLFSHGNIASMAVSGLYQFDNQAHNNGNTSQCIGLIALGSCDAHYFNQRADTLFLSYLAKQISQIYQANFERPK